MITGPDADPVGRMVPPVVPGDRLTLRQRLTDGSAGDAIGWVDRLDPTTVTLARSDGSALTVSRPMIIAARRVPPAAGGPDPLRVPAEVLQRVASTGWVDRAIPLGDWQLRLADGFTRRANSALAVGDPGTDIPAAAQLVIDFYAPHDLLPLAQVITGGPVDHALRELGWHPGGPETELMVIKLAALLDREPPPVRARPDPATTRPDPTPTRPDPTTTRPDPTTTRPDPTTTRPEPTTTRPEPVEGHLTLTERPGRSWVEALATQRGTTLDRLGAAAHRVVAGDGRAVFAAITGPDGPGSPPIAIGRGHLADGWLGVSGIWTDPTHRRRGHATAILLALAGRAARQGARYAYLQVEQDNETARLGYLRLGFRHHHGYGYLTPRPTEP